MKLLIWLAVSFWAMMPYVVWAQDPNPMAQIQASYIEGNVPVAKDFEAFLSRDLRTYFKARLKKPVEVKYEPLRNGATQSGVSYPKYYLWVTVFVNKKMMTQGAVRVAAVDKKRFDITDFLSVSELRKSPEAIDSTFPIPVGVKIRERLQRSGTTKQK
ncbi:MAG: hypothetical protein H8F28_10645 [Fibrella sp.]|nr:hypothetical protein [Armatimonadota bacterium]